MAEQFEEFVSWVLEKKKISSELSLNEDLVDAGVLDSLFFVEYILMIQELSGRDIEVGEELLDTTRTLERVRLNYFH